MIPFNKPYMTGRELEYIAQSHANGQLAGDGPFTRKCHQWLEQRTGTKKALLTHSCTAALEMAGLLLGIQPGDEIIMPSFTFVSTANAFVLRGGVPVFVDIREDTLNLDETKIDAAITKKTRAILPVHYAGVACEMDVIEKIAAQHKLAVIEDAAQGIMASYKGRALGSIGTLGCYSFHETKNLISGEGGALLVNDAALVERAQIIRDKGTDRSKFLQGLTDKYTWQEAGSSFLPGELIAAFLWAQLEQAERITAERMALWQRYHAFLQQAEQAGKLRRPIIPAYAAHNAHLYYVLLRPGTDRAAVLAGLQERKVNAVFHYVPLHASPAGQKHGRISGDLTHTQDLAARLIRLPLWLGMTESEQSKVVSALMELV